MRQFTISAYQPSANNITLLRQTIYFFFSESAILMMSKRNQQVRKIQIAWFLIALVIGGMKTINADH